MSSNLRVLLQRIAAVLLAVKDHRPKIPPDVRTELNRCLKDIYRALAPRKPPDASDN